MMKRRNFLSLSALAAAVPCVVNAEKQPEEEWWEMIDQDDLKFKAKSEEGNITLDVELFRPPEGEVIEITDKEGNWICYRYNGKDMPPRFWPGQSLLVRFDFSWDGKAIPIPERLWNDLAGLQIQTSTLDPKKLDEELSWKAEVFLARLKRPRLQLSAEGGTVLIEWERSEECDSMSTIRWIVSKSGNVLRHRYEPPHEC